jgi:hypothetical protein
MHPYMTAELVRQHRTHLTGEADQRRFTKPLRHRQDPTSPTSRLAAMALLFTRRIRALAA